MGDFYIGRRVGILRHFEGSDGRRGGGDGDGDEGKRRWRLHM